MRNHVTPEKLQYILQYTDKGVLQNVDVTPDFANWKSFETDIVRDDLTAAYILIQDGGISFTGEAYSIVKSIYETQGVMAEAKLVVNMRKDTFPNLWTYEQKVVLDLNFSKYTRDNTEITLTANENGLKSMIKSNGSQKYDIDVTMLSPENLIYDGLEIAETITWFPEIIGDVKPVIQTLQSDTGYRQTVLFYPGFEIETQDVNPNYVNGLLQINQVLQRSTSTGLQIWDGSTWQATTANPCILTSSLGQIFNVSISATLKANFGLPVENLSIFLIQYSDDSNVFVDNGPFAPYDSKAFKICDIPNSGTADISAVLNGNISVTTDDILCNLAICVQFDRVTGVNGESIVLNQFEFESGGIFQIEWTALPKNSVDIPIVREQKLGQALIDQMTETNGTYTVDIDPHAETIRLAAGESIRNFQYQYFHTSFNDFCAYLKSCWGYSYEVVGNIVHFAHVDSFFTQDEAIYIPEISNYKFSINESYLYTGVKIGIEAIQYQSINGTDEFRFLEQWSTGVNNVVNVLDLTCPYRTDAYGFQLLSEKQQIKNSTDDQSDNSIFVVHVSKSGSNYILNRSAVISGVTSTSTMFNACFSPRQCLIRNASLLGISGKTLKFTSTAGNADIIINGVSEKADIVVEKSLFTADVLDFDIGYISDLPIKQNGLVKCLCFGEVYAGYIKKIAHFWGQDQKTSWTMFIYGKERDKSRDNDYDKRDYSPLDYNAK